MKPGRCSVIGQAEGRIECTIAFNAQVSGRDKDHAIEIHPVCILQFQGQPGYTRRTIAFADEIFGRSPAALARHKVVEPLGEVLDISVDSEEFLLRSILDEYARIAC